MSTSDTLTPEELERYNRQMMLPDFGVEGQEKLKKATALVVGAGGLGCPIATYLAAAGVGRIRIVDFDRVDVSNLNRQVLHWQENIGHLKAQSAGEKLSRLNPYVEIESITEALDEENLDSLLSGVDVIVDALDNFDTRQILNRGAVTHTIPFIYGGINGLVGMATTILPGSTPCLACIFPHKTPKEVFPVLGTTPAVIGVIQATEAIKLIVGLGKSLAGRLLIYNGEDMSFNHVSMKRDPQCPVCGTPAP